MIWTPYSSRNMIRKKKLQAVTDHCNCMPSTNVENSHWNFCWEDHLLHNMLPSNDQKGCKKESRDTTDQLLIDEAILRNCRRACKEVAIGWIDYKKAYDMVPQSWLKEAVELVRLADDVNKILFNIKERWKNILTANNQLLRKINIRRGTFQGDTLSPLLFVIVLLL